MSEELTAAQDEVILDDSEMADDGPPQPNFLPPWLTRLGGCLVLVVVIILIAAEAADGVGGSLSEEQAQAQALWVDYKHSVTTVGGGSAGNGGANSGLHDVCPGSPEPEAAADRCELTFEVLAPCWHVLALVNGRVVGKAGWRDCHDSEYDGTAWHASREWGVDAAVAHLLRAPPSRPDPPPLAPPPPPPRASHPHLTAEHVLLCAPSTGHASSSPSQASASRPPLASTRRPPRARAWCTRAPRRSRRRTTPRRPPARWVRPGASARCATYTPRPT